MCDSNLTLPASGVDSHKGKQHQVQKDKVEDHLEAHVNGKEANRRNGNLRKYGKGQNKLLMDTVKFRLKGQHYNW